MNATEQNTGVYTRILAVVLGLWLLLRSVNSDSTGRTLIDYIIGNKATKSPYLSQQIGATVSGTGSTSPSAKGTSAAAATATATNVLSVLFGGVKYTLNRRDQGRDVQTAPNTSIHAPGAGYLVRNGSNPGTGGSGFGTQYPIVHFTSGPWAGLDIYFGHVKSLLSAGQHFSAGQAIAQTQNGQQPYSGGAPPGWVEIGLAPGGNPGPMGQALPPGL